MLASVDLFHVSPYFPRYPVEVFQPYAHHDEGSSSELVVERQGFPACSGWRRFWSILSLLVCFASNTTARPPGGVPLEVRLPGFGVASKEPALSVWLPEWLHGLRSFFNEGHALVTVPVQACGDHILEVFTGSLALESFLAMLHPCKGGAGCRIRVAFAISSRNRVPTD